MGYSLPWNKYCSWRNTRHNVVLVGPEWLEKLVLPGVAEEAFKETCLEERFRLNQRRQRNSGQRTRVGKTKDPHEKLLVLSHIYLT